MINNTDAKEAAIRVVMMPKDLNHQNTVFGGVILSYIDQAGFVEAQRQQNHRYVTASISRVDFKSPVFPGDIVSFYAKTIKIGNTSICVKVDVYAEHGSGLSELVTEAELTYVALDRNGRPTTIKTKNKEILQENATK